MELEDVYWIHLAGVRDQWRIVVNGQWNSGCGGNYLISFSWRVLLRIARRCVCVSEWVSEWMSVCVYLSGFVHTLITILLPPPKSSQIDIGKKKQLYAGQMKANFWAGSWSI